MAALSVAWLMHAQSLLWYALLVLCATRLYRRLFALPDPDTGDAAQAPPWPAWAAGLAAVLYAVDDAHGVPAAWLVHRNGVVAATFALLTLACHLRWRCDGWRPGAVLAPLALGAGLLVGEAALGAAAYLFAFALLLDPLTRQPWAPRRRLLTLWAYAGCVVLWRLVHQRLGGGAFGSGAYLDPVREPLTFAAATAQRTPLLLAGQLGRPPRTWRRSCPRRPRRCWRWRCCSCWGWRWRCARSGGTWRGG